jgi:DNA-binding GntR family transcriptional regulator
MMSSAVERAQREETTMVAAATVFDRRTLRERCTTHVRDQIISGRITPGEHLVETRLSDELGVSRGTLREALRPLVNEGLIVSDGRGHLLVREITSDEIREVFDVRTALEILAATTLAQRDDRRDVAAELRRAIEPLRDPTLSFGDQMAADLGFHELLCSRTGNATLLRHWQQLIGQIEMMIIAAGTERAASRMRYEDHVGIADAIAEGDAAQARAVVERHFEDFASRYLSDGISQTAARTGAE